jgi:hypothetical protein
VKNPFNKLILKLCVITCSRCRSGGQGRKPEPVFRSLVERMVQRSTVQSTLTFIFISKIEVERFDLNLKYDINKLSFRRMFYVFKFWFCNKPRKIHSGLQNLNHFIIFDFASNFNWFSLMIDKI